MLHRYAVCSNESNRRQQLECVVNKRNTFRFNSAANCVVYNYRESELRKLILSWFHWLWLKASILWFNDIKCHSVICLLQINGMKEDEIDHK